MDLVVKHGQDKPVHIEGHWCVNARGFSFNLIGASR